MIGGSKGVAMAQVTPDDLEEFAGTNTIEGAAGRHRQVRGKGTSTTNRTAPMVPRSAPQQGQKTHEQELRKLERKA